MAEIDYRDTLLFYPDEKKDFKCETTDLNYKPVILLKHHYPTQYIVDKARQNEKEVRKINSEMSKYRRNIDGFIQSQLKGITINADIDYNGVIEEILQLATGRTFEPGLSEIKKKTALKLANIRKIYSDSNRLDKYNDLFTNGDKPMGLKMFQYFWELPDQRENLRKLVSEPMVDIKEERHKYIFVGRVKNEAIIIPILEKIENTREISEDDYVILIEEFGEDFEEDWKELGIEYCTTVKFIYYYIFPHSSVYYIQRLIEIILGLSINKQYVWTYSQLGGNIDNYKFFFDSLYFTYYDPISNGVPKARLNQFLTDILGISPSKLEEVYGDKKIAELNVLSRDDMMNGKILSSFLVSYFEYQSLSQQQIFNQKWVVGTFPDTNPYYGFLNEDVRVVFNRMLNDKKVQYDNTNQNRTLGSFGPIERNEIHFVSSLDLNDYLLTIMDVQDIDNRLNDTVHRYFNNIKTIDEMSTNVVYNPSDDEVANLKKTTEIFKDVSNFDFKMPNAMNFRVVGKNVVKFELCYRSIFKDFDSINLRDVMNDIPLSDEFIPFVRYYDEQRNENVYKVFKDSFTNDRDDRIKKNVYENWIDKKTFTMNLAKLTKTNEVNKCLTFKIKLCNQIVSYNEPMEISVYRQHTKTIDNSASKFTSKVPLALKPMRKFIVYYREAMRLEHYVEEYLFTPDKKGIYKHKPIYLDVYLFNSDGRMKMQAIFDPDGFYRPEYLDCLYNVTNYFNEMMNSLPYCLNRIDYNPLCKILNRPNEYFLSNTLHLSSIVEYKYNTHNAIDFIIDPITFREVVAKFSPFFYLVEPIYTKESNIDFFINGKWFKGAKILEINKDGTYLISFKKGQIPDVKPWRIKSEAELSKNQFLNFRYKRVNYYKREGPLIELLKKYTSWGLSEMEIKQNIQKEFDISDDNLAQLKTQTEEKSKLDENRIDINGIDIKLYFNVQETRDKSYKIEIDRYKSEDDFKIIIFLLDILFKIYYKDYVLKLTGEKTQEVENKEELDDELNNQMDVHDVEYDPYGDLFDQDIATEEAYEDDTINELVEKTKKEQAINENIIEFNYEMLGNSSNLFLENLYSIDQHMFKWESKDEKKKYTIACQGTKRYPKVVGTEKFISLDDEFNAPGITDGIDTENKLPFKAGLGKTYLGNKEGIVDDANVTEEYCKPGQEINSNKNCVSIQYGSQKDQESWQNVFMCPKIWCIVDRIPLHPRHLLSTPTDKCTRFVSQADITTNEIKTQFGSMKKYEKVEYQIWRLCKNCGDDILNHEIRCPICKRGVLDPKNANNIPTKTTSIYILPKEENYIYPGFINKSKHPLAIPSVCCFNNPNTRLAEKFNIVEKRQQNVNAGRYIQSFGKLLDRGRIGQLPRVFAGFFNLSNEYFTSATLMCNKGETRFYRFGVEQNNNNVLDCLRAFLLDFETFKTRPNFLLDKMIDNITPNIIRNIPLLEFAMRDIGPNVISPMQNFIEYLISNNYKYDFSLLQFLNHDMTWLELGGNTDIDKTDQILGLNIFIFSVNDDGKLVLELPMGYLQPYKFSKKSKCLLLLKKTKTLDVDSEDNTCEIENRNLPLYEPIFAVQFKCKENEGGREELYQKYFEQDHPIIQKIMNIIDKTTLEKPAELLFDKTHISMNNYDIDWLYSNLDKTITISKIVLDSTNLIVGAILDNGLYIPLYPTNYSKKFNLEETTFLEFLNGESLLDYDNTLTSLQQLSIKEGFDWLKPIKIITNKNEDFCGFLLNTNTIVPFKPISTINNQEYAILSLDFKDIETKIMDNFKKIKYSNPITFEDLIRENFNLADIKPVVKDGILISVELNNPNKKIKNLLIPLENVIYNQDVHGKIQPLVRSKKNFVELVRSYQILYQQTLGRIRCRPVSIITDDTKFIVQIVLETGDKITVSKRENVNRLGERDPKSGKFYAHIIQEVELDYLMNTLSSYDWNRYDMALSNGDSRVHFIQALNYKKNSYQRFRFEVAQILANESRTTTTKNKTKEIIEEDAKLCEKLTYKECIKKILATPQSNNKKRLQIIQIIEQLVRMYMTVKDITDEEKNKMPLANMLNSCLNYNKNNCEKDPYCLWRPYGETKEEYMAKKLNPDITKPLNISEIKKFLNLFGIEPSGNFEMDTHLYYEKKYEYHGIQGVLEKYTKSETTRKQINDELRINGYNVSNILIDNVRTYVKLREKGQCRLKLDKNGEDNIRRMEFVRKIVEEIVRNNIKRSEILNNKIRLVETKLSYHIYNGEYLFTQGEIKTKQHLTIYCKELNNRLRILNFFTRNSSLYEFEVPEMYDLEFKDKVKSYRLVVEDYFINFNMLEKDEIFNIPDEFVTRSIRVLDNEQSKQFLLKIMRLNTILDKSRITNIENDVEFTLIRDN